jgi:hypothetical protein
MVRLYAEGLTRGKIARLFNTSVQTVTRQLIAAQVALEARTGDSSAGRTPEQQAVINAKVSEARKGKGTGARAAREDRPCEVCGTTFHVLASSKQRFCSRSCRNDGLARDNRQQAEKDYAAAPRVCPCGERIPFEFRHTRQFCSPEHRSLYAPKRQADPTKQITFDCATCGTSVTRRKGYSQSISGKQFCSNECAAKHTKTVKNYVLRDQDMVLDSRWEVLVVGLLGYRKIACERFDRSDVIEWSPGHWYGPDLVVPTYDGPIYIEVKGYEQEHDAPKWEAFRAAGNRLVTIDQDLMEQMLTSTDLLALLWIRAIWVV